MRTTLTIDDDVLAVVRELARAEHSTAGRVLSDLARTALTRVGETGDEVEEFYGFRPLPRRGVVVTSEIVNRIRDEEGI